MQRFARFCERGAAALVVVALAGGLSGLETPAGASPAGRRDPPAGGVTYSVGAITKVSVGCPGTGDISDAVDPARGIVYVEFEGCDKDNGIGFARSTDDGRSFAAPVALPGSNGGWDPSVAVAPDGTLYAAFMNTLGHRTYPVVDVSHDHGRNFTVEQTLRPKAHRNWGDADYIAVSSKGALYVAWDYGPSNAEVRSKCSRNGSCWATNGDLNVVVQRSTDDARSFTPMSVVNPGYPDGGDDEGDLTLAPDGAVDVLYQGYRVVDRRTLKLADGHEYFTTSTDGGRKWSAPVEVGAGAGKITINEWWNDGSISTDAAGNLYASWDTQGGAGKHETDTGWVSWSANRGRTWSAPLRTTPATEDVPHITEVDGAGPGRAYVAWLSSTDPRGYALYVRTLSITSSGKCGRWLSDAVRVSRQFGNPKVFPGDTFGIAAFSRSSLVFSWGSAVPGSHGSDAVWAARVHVTRR